MEIPPQGTDNERTQLKRPWEKPPLSFNLRLYIENTSTSRNYHFVTR